MQRSFVDHYLETFNARQSAISAGYADSVVRNATVDVLGSDQVKQEIENRLTALTEENARIFVKGSRKAISALIKIIDDPEASDGAKVSACKEILDRGAHFARLGLEGVGGEASEAARTFDHILRRYHTAGARSGSSDDGDGEGK